MTAEALRYIIIISSTATLVIIAVVIHIIAKARYKKDFLKKKEELQSFRLKEIEQYETEINRLIDEINSKKANREFLEELISDCEKYVAYRYSGRQIVDALLAYKQKACVNSGIQFEIKADALSATALTDEEYVSIFGNLLDNAIEAALKSASPWIALKSVTAGGQWILTIRNSKTTDEKPLENGMKTTKDDNINHGLGSKIVKKTVKKHHGAVEYKDGGDYFEAIVAIPLSDGATG